MAEPTWVQAAASVCFKPFTLDEALRGLAEGGFENVEIGAVKGEIDHLDPDDLGPQAVRDTARLLERYGLTVVSFSGHSHLDTDLGRDRLRRVVRAASELGAGVVNTYTGEGGTEEQRRTVIANVREVADEAAERGVTICLETDSNMLPTAAVGREILAEVDHPAVKLNYDPGNVLYYIEGVRPEEDVQHALDVLGHVHLKDKTGGLGVLVFPPPGEGEIDLPAVLGPILRSGYTGTISMEIELGHDWPDWETCLAGVKRGKAYWDSLEL